MSYVQSFLVLMVHGTKRFLTIYQHSTGIYLAINLWDTLSTIYVLMMSGIKGGIGTALIGFQDTRTGIRDIDDPRLCEGFPYQWSHTSWPGQQGY